MIWPSASTLETSSYVISVQQYTQEESLWACQRHFDRGAEKKSQDTCEKESQVAFKNPPFKMFVLLSSVLLMKQHPSRSSCHCWWSLYMQKVFHILEFVLHMDEFSLLAV